ncbi:hypothetical protein LZ554_003202 [Drepanopeziza brunnea f. sp. 'monogermtubi']|nr:hypothetical protein LZ554_003202 [Drepanopeziza brunnea f. sp. 'monogermtubi']
MAPPYDPPSLRAGPSRRQSGAETADRVTKNRGATGRSRPSALDFARTRRSSHGFDSDDSLPSHSDDEHSSRQFNIDLAARQLEGAVDATHIELSRRAAITDSPYAAIVYKHLVATTPPNSPTTPPKPHLSPRSKAFQETLKGKDFQVWTKNRQEWQEKRDALDVTDDRIGGMLSRGDRRGSRASRRYSSTMGNNLGSQLREIERLQKSKLPLYRWFHQNKFLMDGVYAKFKKLEVEIDNGSQYSTDDYVIQWTYDHGPGEDITTFDFFRKKRFTTWLRPAFSDLENEIRKLERESASNYSKMVEVKDLRDLLQKEMEKEIVTSYKEDLETDKAVFNEGQIQSQGFEASIDRILKARYDSKIAEISFAARQEDKVSLYNSKITELTALDGLFRGERLLNRIIGQILNFVAGGVENEIFDFSTNAGVDFFENLYYACYHHHHKQVEVQEQKSVFKNGEHLSTRKKGKIVNLIESHYTFDKEDRRDLERLQNRKASTFDKDLVKTARGFFKKEQNRYSGLVRYTVAIFRERDLPPTARVLEPVSTPPPADHLLRPKRSLFWTGLELAAAEKYLVSSSGYFIPNWKTDREYDQKSTRYLDVLEGFFMSPDVFPEFGLSGDTWSLKEFVTAVNKHLYAPIPEIVLEAFVTYCHHTSQLFYIGAQSRRIAPITRKYGWVNCHEEPVGGPRRKVTYDSKKKPKGLADLEELVLQNLRIDPNKAPLYLASDILGAINAWKPKILGFVPKLKMDPATYKKHLRYWSEAGTFFVYRTIHDDKILIRVNNGWPVDLKGPLTPLTPAMIEIPERFFSSIERDVLSRRRNITNVLTRFQSDTLREWQLYDLIYNPNKQSSAVSWTISRRMFHLFLRCCTTAGKLFG